MTVRAYISGCAGTELKPEERALFADAPPWGLILFLRNCESPEQIEALVASFRELVGRVDAPVLIDQEGGRVQRLRPPLAPNYPPAARFGALHGLDAQAGIAAARLGARLIGADLAALGINVDCLPVLDLGLPVTHKVIGDRAYGGDMATVITLGRAVCEGLLSAGVLPVIKHIPGHGRAMADSHLELPVVATPAAELAATDFVPFAALADMPLAMTAHVVYSALDAERPATTSPTVISEIIRGHIGFSGLLMSDDLSMKALAGSFAARTEAAIAAGCDVVLHCNGEFDEMAEVAAAAPALSGEAERRANAALQLLAEPDQAFDEVAARLEFESLFAALA
ncbi:MAG TPA: beta-N-acetylhexosaminidase [Hyphomicrobiales bacterium]|nr:beta-N-acetylhexosaminidase [Hyphomicrobiales bacterium]